MSQLKLSNPLTLIIPDDKAVSLLSNLLSSNSDAKQITIHVNHFKLAKANNP
jgi:hypothetical protein